MKKSNLFILVIAAPMLLAGITSCGNNTHKVKHGDFVKNTELRYLYEVTYNDYSWDDVTAWMNSANHQSANQAAFGCSSVRYGNYYGRSFDFCVTDMCEFLVRTKHENGHYASIGISIADCKTNRRKVEDGSLNDKLIPFAMVDGINENGVVCNTNVVPAKDLTPLEGQTKYHTRGTNPGKKDLFYQFMPRFILDNAKSAKDAINLLKNRNITAVNKNGDTCDLFGVNNMGYELHCMIADKNDTYIIELVDNKMSIIAGNVMTNFYLSKMTPSGAGFERYQVLYNRKKDQYSEETLDITRIEDMEQLIQYVQYAPCYNPDWRGAEVTENCAKWPTEFAGSKVDEKFGPITFYNAEQWCRENWSEGIGMSEILENVYKDVVKKRDHDNERTSELGGNVPWISTHAEAYDIDNRILHLVTQEQMKQGKTDSYDFKEFKL